MNALEIKNFTKTYDNKTNAVDDLNLYVREGALFGLLGANGAGKTTAINCTVGIAQITAGTIEVFGHNVQSDYKQARTLVGLSPQEFNADVFAPIEKIMDYVGGYFGMQKTDRIKRIDELFEIFDLQDHRKKPFGKLSGGLKRRLVLARAMMHDPKLLILDEPTAGVDVEQRHQLWEYLKKLHAHGKTIILTSHYLEEVEELCSRVAIINKGKLIATVTKEEFTKDKQTLEKYYLDTIKDSEKKNV
ncbi:MAG: ABC transporter ATP-binding protein [Patescibacteria group bacterium]